MPIFAIAEVRTMLIIDVFAWFVIQVGLGLVIFYLPDSLFDYRKRLFGVSERQIEKYRKLKIQKWKGKLPEFPGVGRYRFKQKNLQNTSAEYLDKFITATCRVEAVHTAVILPVAFFFLWNTPSLFLLNIAYILCVNVPYIMIQRYNRYRMLDFLKRQQNENAVEGDPVNN